MVGGGRSHVLRRCCVVVTSVELWRHASLAGDIARPHPVHREVLTKMRVIAVVKAGDSSRRRILMRWLVKD